MKNKYFIGLIILAVLLLNPFIKAEPVAVMTNINMTIVGWQTNNVTQYNLSVLGPQNQIYNINNIYTGSNNSLLTQEMWFAKAVEVAINQSSTYNLTLNCIDYFTKGCDDNTSIDCRQAYYNKQFDLQLCRQNLNYSEERLNVVNILNATTCKETLAATTAQYTACTSDRDKYKLESEAWYQTPILFLIIGGIIGYAIVYFTKIKSKQKTTATEQDFGGPSYEGNAKLPNEERIKEEIRKIKEKYKD